MVKPVENIFFDVERLPTAFASYNVLIEMSIIKKCSKQSNELSEHTAEVFEVSNIGLIVRAVTFLKNIFSIERCSLQFYHRVKKNLEQGIAVARTKFNYKNTHIRLSTRKIFQEKIRAALNGAESKPRENRMG